MERYHKALVAEIEQFAYTRELKVPIQTIHFGGGTPSTYPPGLLLDMFGILKKNFIIDPEAEIALEVNPGTVSDAKIAAWREAGINRLSIGVQALNDKVLHTLNRHQTSSQVIGLLEKVSPFFDNLSIDLILGLPGISGDEWCALIDTVMQWPIKHISIYFLNVHENTPLYFKVQANQITIPADEDIVALYLYTCDILAQHGFEQYELSNFAKQGYASRHNTAYWNRGAYKGFGLGACSFDGKIRSQHEKNIMKYMELAEQHKPVTIFAEELNEAQVWLEKLMLGLRRPQGVESTLLIEGASAEEVTRRGEVLQRLVDDKYIEYHGARVRLTRQGLALENEILAQLTHI